MTRIVGIQRYREDRERERPARPVGRDQLASEGSGRVTMRPPLSAAQRAHRVRMLGHLTAVARSR